MAETVYLLGILLAVSAGSAGFVLAVLAWTSFRGAPFGNALAVLVYFMATFTVYHAALGLQLELPVYVLAIESLAFALVAVFIGMMVRLHRKNFRVARDEVSAE